MAARHTKIVVGAVIGAPLLYLAFYLTNTWAGFALAALLLYETWTLLNRYPEDTISEAFWALARRPLVPFLVGVGTGWALAVGVLANPWLVLAIGILLGHLVWQSQDKYEAAAVPRKED